MSNELEAQLLEEVDEAAWEWLEPHLQRDAVIFVSQQLPLVQVAAAIANDQVAIVQDWITQQLIFKPSPTLVEQLNQTPDRRFQSLIVQPYVLLQEKLETSETSPITGSDA
jgi:hypothetical protein